MEAFAGAGHTVGNHSWSHPDYDTLTRWAFAARSAAQTAPFGLGCSGAKYYRFPFLREGKTEKSKRAAEQVLQNQGYVNVPVTIDNDEWRFNLEYVDALEMGDQQRRGQDRSRISSAYERADGDISKRSHSKRWGATWRIFCCCI